MRVLHCVESYYPALGGMQEVVKQLSERLAALGHDVTVATKKNADRNNNLIRGVNIVDFEIGGNLVNGITGEKEAYEKYLLESDFDIVTFFAAQQWATDVALPILEKIKGKKVSVPTGYSGLYWKAYGDYFEKMKLWIQHYDMNVYLSDDYRDINFAREAGVKHMSIIPNGAAEDEFLIETSINVRKELNLPKNEFLVLHVGSYTGWKGHHDAMEIFLRSKLKNATLIMIGNNSEGFAISKKKNFTLYALRLFYKYFGSKKIIFNYYNRAFTVAAYKQSNLFLFPSNIECSPIVLFECAAAGLPFLASDVGNSVEIAHWTGGGVILPTNKNSEGFSFVDKYLAVNMLNDLYDDAAKRKSLSSISFNNWKNKFSWEIIAKRYEQMYKDLLKI